MEYKSTLLPTRRTRGRRVACSANGLGDPLVFGHPKWIRGIAGILRKSSAYKGRDIVQGKEFNEEPSKRNP